MIPIPHLAIIANSLDRGGLDSSLSEGGGVLAPSIAGSYLQVLVCG